MDKTVAFNTIDLSKGWYPLDILYKDDIPLLYLKRLSEAEPHNNKDKDSNTPFFKMEFETDSEACFVPLDTIEIEGELTISRPIYFIYHASRCGSTLCTQMLRKIPNVRVFSEPLGLTQVFSSPKPVSNDLLKLRLKKVVKLLDIAVPDEYQHLVVKWGSWATLMWKLINDTTQPKATSFIWRDPVEIASSLLKKTPKWYDASELNQIFQRYAPDFLPAQVAADTESLARLLAATLKAGCDMPNETLLLNYKNIPNGIIDDLCPHFGFELSVEAKQQMIDASKYDAKEGSNVVFKPDSELKQNHAPNDVKYFINKYAAQYVKQLN